MQASNRQAKNTGLIPARLTGQWRFELIAISLLMQKFCGPLVKGEFTKSLIQNPPIPKQDFLTNNLDPFT